MDSIKSSVFGPTEVGEGTYPHACYDGVVFLAYTVFDDEVGDEVEKIEAGFSVNFNGQVVRKGHTTGTYTVKADCTGTGTAAGTQFDMFIAPDGSKFTFVIIKPKAFVASGFEERATAKRVGP